jgi:hypothetical protein
MAKVQNLLISNSILLSFHHCNTLCYGSPNPSLITFISDLGMHGWSKLVLD